MKALIIHGGWDGHEPGPVSQIFRKALQAKGVEVEMSDKLDPLADAEKMKAFDVFTPIWTMGTMSGEQWNGLNAAVKAGMGIAGVHGGMGDAFRANLDYQWMVGGQFVGHPHVGDYEVKIADSKNPITEGMKSPFPYKSEQYYHIIDPGVHTLATTLYKYDGYEVTMPCIWTKTWGKGRVFYSALGHCAKEFTDYPEVLAMTIRGIIWAGAGKAEAAKCGCCCGKK